MSKIINLSSKYNFYQNNEISTIKQKLKQF